MFEEQMAALEKVAELIKQNQEAGAALTPKDRAITVAVIAGRLRGAYIDKLNNPAAYEAQACVEEAADILAAAEWMYFTRVPAAREADSSGNGVEEA